MEFTETHITLLTNNNLPIYGNLAFTSSLIFQYNEHCTRELIIQNI